MDHTQIEKLIMIGLHSFGNPAASLYQLDQLYSECQPDDAASIHQALRGITETFDRSLETFNHPMVSARRQVFAGLANRRVPGLTNQVIVPARPDPNTDFVHQLQTDYPCWDEFVQTTVQSINAHRLYVNNREAVAAVIQHVPTFRTQTAKTAFLRALGENPDTAQLINCLTNAYSLEAPMFPYDWTKNLYYLLGFHQPDPHPHVSRVRMILLDKLAELYQRAEG